MNSSSENLRLRSKPIGKYQKTTLLTPLLLKLTITQISSQVLPNVCKFATYILNDVDTRYYQ